MEDANHLQIKKQTCKVEVIFYFILYLFIYYLLLFYIILYINFYFIFEAKEDAFNYV